MLKLKELYFDFIFLLRTGRLNDKLHSKPKFWLVILGHFILSLSVVIVCSSLSVLYHDYFHISKFKPFVYNEGHSLYSLLSVVILAPVLEELSMRYPLKKSTLSTSFFFAILFYGPANRLFHLDLIIRVVLSVSIFIGVFFIVKLSIIDDLLNRIYNHPKILLYGLASIFGVLHLSRYEVSLRHIAIVPFDIIPYIFSGLVFSYVRLRFSIKHSVILHSINNSFVAIPAYLCHLFGY